MCYDRMQQAKYECFLCVLLKSMAAVFGHISETYKVEKVHLAFNKWDCVHYVKCLCGHKVEAKIYCNKEWVSYDRYDYHATAVKGEWGNYIANRK